MSLCKTFVFWQTGINCSKRYAGNRKYFLPWNLFSIQKETFSNVLGWIFLFCFVFVADAFPICANRLLFLCACLASLTSVPTKLEFIMASKVQKRDCSPMQALTVPDSDPSFLHLPLVRDEAEFDSTMIRQHPHPSWSISTQ